MRCPLSSSLLASYNYTIRKHHRAREPCVFLPPITNCNNQFSHVIETSESQQEYNHDTCSKQIKTGRCDLTQQMEEALLTMISGLPSGYGKPVVEEHSRCGALCGEFLLTMKQVKDTISDRRALLLLIGFYLQRE